MKTCSICKQKQDLSEYNKNKTKPDGLQTVCRSCNREKSRNYYSNNKEKQSKLINSRTKKIRLERRQYLWNYFDSHPCVDCGNTEKIVLEFDHITGVKINGVAKLAHDGAPIKVIDEEIAKCEVRCKNCHVKATYARLGGSWHDKFLTS